MAYMASTVAKGGEIGSDGARPVWSLRFRVQDCRRGLEWECIEGVRICPLQDTGNVVSRCRDWGWGPYGRGGGQVGFEGSSKYAERCAVRIFDSGGPGGASCLWEWKGEFTGARE